MKFKYNAEVDTPVFRWKYWWKWWG